MPLLQVPVLEQSKGKTPKKPILERFSSKYKVNSETSCWEWTDFVSKLGYGRMKVNGKFIVASRLSYMLFNGDIPFGLVVDHLCRVRHCVNPDHLEAVSNYENCVVRGSGPMAVKARQTHCKRGHEFTEENTHRFAQQNSTRHGRQCKQCAVTRKQETKRKRIL